MKKLLATIMALVMALSLLPTAWATDDNNSEAKPVAKVGSITYTNLADAVKAVANVTEKSIELVDNATLTQQLDLSNVTIKGNGHTISAAASTTWNSNDSGKHLINMGSNVVLNDVTLDCQGTSGGVQAYKATGVTLHNVTVKNTTAACALNVNASQVTLTGTFAAEDCKWGEKDSNYINLAWGSGISDYTGKCTVDISNATLNGVTMIWTDSDDLSHANETTENYDSKFAVIGADAKEWGKNTVTYEANKTGIAYYPLKMANIEITGSTSAKLSAKTATLNYTYNGDAEAVNVGSSDASVAAVEKKDNNTLTVTLKKAGETTITVSADKTSVYKAASDTFVLTVLAVGETKTTNTTSGKTTTTTVNNVNIDTATTTEKVTVEIDATDTSDAGKAATETTVTIPTAVTGELKSNSAKIEEVVVETNVATLTINSAALKDLTSNEGDLVLTVSKTTKSATETKFDLTAKVGDTNVFTNSKGKITVTVPMAAPGFRQQHVCYYVADNGTRTRMGGTGYKNGEFSWDTNHFSTFVVVTETVSTNRAYIDLNGSSGGTTTTTTTTTTGKAASAKTFDAGVGIYAATALLSVTGMAWVGKKKH